MARYELAATKTSGAAAGMIAQLRTGSARDLRIFEISVQITTAVAASIGLIRPSAVGATFTSTATGQALDPSTSAGVAVIDTAATTPPTIGATYMRQAGIAAVIGNGVLWQFPYGIVVPVSSSIAIWQTSAAAVGYAVSFSYDE